MPRSEPASGAVRFLPLIGVGAMVAVSVVVWRAGMVARGPAAVALPAMMLVSVVGMALHAGARHTGGSVDRQRKRYLSELRRLGEQLCDAAQRQQASAHWLHPAPASLWTLVGGARMWERATSDQDFGHVRVGVGRQRLARRIVLPPVAPVDELDPVTADALRRFVHSHATLGEIPVAVALCGVRVVSVEGDPVQARSLVRSMICQLAVLHSPDSVAIAATAATDRRQHWDWLKWLPHNGDGAAQQPHRVLITDGVDHHAHVRAGTTVIVVGAARTDEALRLRVDDHRLAMRRGECTEHFAVADSMSMSQARTCARRLARHRDAEVAAEAWERWVAALADPGRLRVPLGAGPDGEFVTLDIKEAADGGDGPHGLCVGATGSGKSELLRTITAGMIARHSPDDLNLVLVDFKGGATFSGLEGLRHVAAVITNLADSAGMVARAQDALGGEVRRRQQLLRHAGNAVNLATYQRRRETDSTLPVLPALFIVVDEFAELLAHQPDFADLFTMIGRVGRSLGMHLLLASQRFDEGRLRGLESHLSYRICLKTATAAESRAVLGTADAAELPTAPGGAMLRTSDGKLVRFQTTYLGGPAPRARTRTPADPAVRLFTAAPAPRPVRETGSQDTAFDAIVARFADRGTPAHRLWLPPLTTSPNLAELSHVPGPPLSAVIGLIDLPFEQRQAPLVVNLDGAGGNVAVVGAPQSGKSTTVRTLITALAARSDSRRIQFYCLDFGGGTLAALRALPHIGSVANRSETELVRRTVSHVGAVVSARESHDDPDQYRDVFLVVDGWATLREEFPDLEAPIAGLATRGLSFGVHVIMTAGRWADIRPALKDQIGTKIELRLGDPIDSEFDRKQAAVVPLGIPGRGITSAGAHFLVATPDGVDVDREGSPRAPAVRLLPTFVDHRTVLDPSDAGPDRILLGVGEDHIAPVDLDFGRQHHLLILGDRECGKTATLRSLCTQLLRGALARLFVIDYRRDLLGLAEGCRNMDYAFSEHVVAKRLPELIAVLRGRLPAVDTSIEQLKARSWWSGPEVFVVVDDYDLVSATSPDALSPLLALLPHAADIGLHMIVARRCAGAARAMYEPLLADLRDSGCSALLMSGSSDEGPLIGHHRAAVQPPGRGLWLTRAGAELIQVGWCPP